MAQPGGREFFGASLGVAPQSQPRQGMLLRRSSDIYPKELTRGMRGFFNSLLARLAAFKLRANENPTPIEVAYAVSAPVWIFTLANANISSASPDCIISSLSLHLFLVFASFVASEKAAEREHDLAELLLLGAACVTVKSSCLGLVVAVWAVCIAVVLLRKRDAGLIFFRKRTLTMAAVAALFMLTWIGRGIILSGYPLFPSSALSMPVAWRMPVHYVKEFRWDTIRWAREADPSISVKKTMRTWRWLPGWFERVVAMPNQFIWPAQVGMAGSAALLAFGFLLAHCVETFGTCRYSSFL